MSDENPGRVQGVPRRDALTQLANPCSVRTSPSQALGTQKFGSHQAVETLLKGQYLMKKIQANSKRLRDLIATHPPAVQVCLDDNYYVGAAGVKHETDVEYTCLRRSPSSYIKSASSGLIAQGCHFILTFQNLKISSHYLG
jgi:hypothetical protein